MTHIHTALISYGRRDLTARAFHSYMETVTDPWSLVIVDNGSDIRTIDELVWASRSTATPVLLLGENRYPGAACNLGWSLAPPQTALLHRSDNDFRFLPGWADHVRERFAEDAGLGQLGLRTDEQELHAPFNVGGNCVIRKTPWNEGLRWDERPWTELGATTEDYYMSQDVAGLLWRWSRVDRPCIEPTSYESRDDPYYQESWRARGIHGF